MRVVIILAIVVSAAILSLQSLDKVLQADSSKVTNPHKQKTIYKNG